MRISMIPFGLLSGFMDGKEIRITELGEDGFWVRLFLRYEKSRVQERGDPEV